jgi:hypothetical protein
VYEGIELPPLAELIPEIDAGTEVAFHEITAPEVAEDILTKDVLVPEQIVWFGTSNVT